MSDLSASSENCEKLVGLVSDGEFDSDGAENTLPGQRSLIDDGAVRPLWGRYIIDFAPEARNIQAVLCVNFVQTDEMRHDVGGIARAGGDKHVDPGSGSAGTRARCLNHDGVRGLVRSGDARNFADLQAGAEQLNARGAKGVSLKQGNLQLPLAEAENHMRLLRNLHKHAGRRALPDHDINRKFAVDAVRHAKDKPARVQ